MTLLHNDILRSVTEDARRLRVKPQRLPRISREELRSLSGSIHREALDMLLLFRMFVVEVKIDDVRSGHGPVSDAGDDEAKDVVRELVDRHIRRSVIKQTLQEAVAVVLLAGECVDEGIEQPAEGPYAGFQFLEVGLDVLLEPIGNFLCTLSQGPAVLWVGIEEDEADEGGVDQPLQRNEDFLTHAKTTEIKS